MTSAYGSATNNVTPRAILLLIQGSVTQNALSTFVGSFLFSMVALVVLKVGVYGPQGRSVLFMMTITSRCLGLLASVRRPTGSSRRHRPQSMHGSVSLSLAVQNSKIPRRIFRTAPSLCTRV
ncbi:DUF2254 family protein [Caballeronia sp. LZ043]|uniref:DUF2254 family protein n=1 Tax=unclassified Caballeronia TaxID=2646786 RepID=UPI0038575BC7